MVELWRWVWLPASDSTPPLAITPVAIGAPPDDADSPSGDVDETPRSPRSTRDGPPLS